MFAYNDLSLYVLVIIIIVVPFALITAHFHCIVRDSVVDNPCVKIMSHAPWTICLEVDLHKSGCVILEYPQLLWKILFIEYIQVVRWPHCVASNYSVI